MPVLDILTKTCTKCKTEKETSCFHLDKNRKDGRAMFCHQCVKIYGKKRYEDNKDRISQRGKEYYAHNKEKISARNKLYADKNKHLKAITDRVYYDKNKESIKEYGRKHHYKNREKNVQASREYYIKNREKCRITQKKWNQENRDKKRESSRKYRKNKKSTDVLYKISNAIRHRLYLSIRGGLKGGSAVKDLGCSVEFLKQHLESQFTDGMTWDNWGNKGWHVDHIIPLAAFDLTDRQHVLLACHYGNLQPLWALDNIRKSDTIPNMEQYYVTAA